MVTAAAGRIFPPFSFWKFGLAEEHKTWTVYENCEKRLKKILSFKKIKLVCRGNCPELDVRSLQGVRAEGGAR